MLKSLQSREEELCLTVAETFRKRFCVIQEVNVIFNAELDLWSCHPSLTEAACSNLGL